MNAKDRVAFVTGAAGGIGAAVAAELLKRGAAKVYAADVDGDRLAERWMGEPRVETIRLDITDDGAVKAVARKAGETAMLFNVAGYCVHRGIIETDDVAALRREMDINYWGTMNMCRAFAPVLAKHGESCLANVLSTLALVTYPFCGNYSATKAAVRAMTEAVRAELMAQGTNVMSIYPGVIDTRMMAKFSAFPKSTPELAATVICDGMEAGAEEVFIGPDAEEVRVAHAKDRVALTRSAYAILPGTVG